MPSKRVRAARAGAKSKRSRRAATPPNAITARSAGRRPSLRVHAAGVDSCEGRLESLKVLYDAGILDRDEYLQRVARVKAQHSHR